MRHFNLIRNILIVLISVSFFSCDREEMTDIQENSMDFQSEIVNQRGSEYEEIFVLIEWYEYVDASRKQAVRDRYKYEGILLDYYVCEDEIRETWTVAKKESDTPVDTDDEVKRVRYDEKCDKKKE